MPTHDNLNSEHFGKSSQTLIFRGTLSIIFRRGGFPLGAHGFSTHHRTESAPSKIMPETESIIANESVERDKNSQQPSSSISSSAANSNGKIDSGLSHRFTSLPPFESSERESSKMMSAPPESTRTNGEEEVRREEHENLEQEDDEQQEELQSAPPPDNTQRDDDGQEAALEQQQQGDAQSEKSAVGAADNPNEPLAPFDWDDLEERFFTQMEECEREEDALMGEFREWGKVCPFHLFPFGSRLEGWFDMAVQVFEAWTLVTRVDEGERAYKRLVFLVFLFGCFERCCGKRMLKCGDFMG